MVRLFILLALIPMLALAGEQSLIVPWFNVNGKLKVNTLAASSISAPTVTATNFISTGTYTQLAAGSYINCGSTVGTSGYGFRDNAGTMEFKNGAGAWTALVAGGTTAGWTDDGTTVRLTTSTDRLGFGTTAPDRKVEINSTDGTCLRLTYNDNNGSAANYTDLVVGSSGDLTITPSGGDIISSGKLNLNATPAAISKIYAVNNNLAIQNGSGYQLQHILNDTTSNPSGNYYPISVNSKLEVLTKSGQSYSVRPIGCGSILADNYVSGKGTVVDISGMNSQITVNNSANITSNYHYYARAPIDNTTGVIGNDYGYYCESLKTAGFVTNGYAFYQAGTSDINYFAGTVGVGVTAPSSAVDIQKAGTVKTTKDFLELTNTANAADMDGTCTGFLWNQFYYDASTPAVSASGRIGVSTETDWTSTASTRDSYMRFSTALDGTVAEKMRITSAGAVGINDFTIANTYDLEVGDSIQIGGNLLLGAYGGAYSYVRPGSGAWVASSTAEIKNIGQEKNIINILDLVKNVEIREWKFDSSKVIEKFVKPSGFDTLSQDYQDSVQEEFRIKAKIKASALAKQTHYTPTAENFASISQQFGGNSKEINYEHVIWSMFMAIKKQNERISDLERRIEKLEIK